MIVVRVDDFPFTKQSERHRHDRESFLRFDDVLSRHLGGAPYLLGAIPALSTDDDLSMLASLGHVTVGMHGVRHDERFPNEFLPHLTERDVHRSLSSARERLRAATGQPVDVYMPPRNVIDRRTLAACGRAGFRAFTSGPETGDVGRTTLARLHSEAPLEYGRSDELLERGSVGHLRRRCESGGRAILALHFTWETNLGLESLDRYLSQLAGMLGGFDLDELSGS
jgi:hypothetical protein